MAVEPDEPHVRQLQSARRNRFGRAGLDAESELGIDFPGCDSVKRVRIDAGRDPKQNVLPELSFRRNAVDRFELIRVVNDEAPDAEIHRKRDIRIGFVARMEPDVLHRKARLISGIELAAGNDVHAEPFLLHDPEHVQKGRCFRCVQHPSAFAECAFDRLPIGAAARADAVLIHQVERRAVFLGQRGNILPAKLQPGALYAKIVRDQTVVHRSVPFLFTVFLLYPIRPGLSIENIFFYKA